MTTPPRGSAQRPRASLAARPAPHREYLAGWRLAARLAWRDIMRHRGRTTLAGLLIALPLFVMAAAVTGMATLGVSGDEQNARTFSRAQQTVEFVSDGQRTNSAAPAKPLPGMTKPASLSVLPTLHGVEAVSGGRVAMIRSVTVTTSSGSHTGRDAFDRVDGDEDLWHSQYDLVDGRWPKNATEVLVTERGVSFGLPTSGQVRVSDGTKPTASGATSEAPLTVVGVVSSYSSAVLVGQKALTGPGNPLFYLADKSDPSLWEPYGGQVATADSSGGSENVVTFGGASGTLFVLLVLGTIAFLAAPAFAASATRSRRALGLIASNGGTAAVLRRIVVTQALIVGALSAAVGTIVGAAVGVVAARNVYRVVPGQTSGPADVPVDLLIAFVVMAIVASFVAALVPAFAAGRTNLLQALRGSVSARRVHTGMPVLGVTLVAFAVGLLFSMAHDVSARQGYGTIKVLIGAPMFFIGAALILPAILAAWGRLATHLPLAMRMAVRDISRQRTRATAAVGATLAAATALMTVAIFAASIDPHLERTHTYSTEVGAGVVDLATRSASADAAFVTKARRALPDLRSAQVSSVGDGPLDPTATTIDHLTQAYFDVTACTPKAISASAGGADVPYDATQNTPTVLAFDTASPFFAHLTTAQRDVLTHGGALVVGDRASSQGSEPGRPGHISPSVIHDGRLRLSTVRASGLHGWNDDPSSERPPLGADRVSCRTAEVPAAVVSREEVGHFPVQNFPSVTGAVIMLESTATAHGLPLTNPSLTITRPGGLTDADETRIDELIGGQGGFSVERGYHSELRPALWIMTVAAAVIILLAAVISTLLSQAESQEQESMLMAVGAPRGLRRRIAAAHAGAIALLGTLTGLALGAGPGIVLAIANTTTDNFDLSRTLDPIVRVPWPYLGGVVIVVPLIAAAIVAASVRRTPAVVRRNAVGG